MAHYLAQQQQQRGLASRSNTAARCGGVSAPLRRRVSRAALRVAATAAPEAASFSAVHARPDAMGRYGKFGGKYVPETLIPALADLEVAYAQAMADPAFHVSGVCRLLLASLGLRGVVLRAVRHPSSGGGERRRRRVTLPPLLLRRVRTH